MSSDPIRFEITATCGQARCGRLHTPHGVARTPAFMAIGTRGAVKGLTPAQLREAGCEILLANTYHLMLRPGAEVVERLGGLHRLMAWDGPILTDSGGYQVFSLAELRRINDDGVEFRSHIDGALVRLDPERSIRIQNRLGADILMAFDECPPLPAERPVLERAVERTLRWARRCRDAHQREDQALFGIVQGGLDPELRRRCLDGLVEIGFDGYAIGGLSVGEPPPEMWRLLAQFAPLLPAGSPRYLMGVGTPRDLVEAIDAGVDLFDCVLPTRNGRKGYAYTSRGIVRLRNAQHRTADEPLDAACDCYACRTFSRGALRHLITSGEVLGATLVSLHNLHFYQRLMDAIREAIARGDWPRWRDAFRDGPLADVNASTQADGG